MLFKLWLVTVVTSHCTCSGSRYRDLIHNIDTITVSLDQQLTCPLLCPIKFLKNMGGSRSSSIRVLKWQRWLLSSVSGCVTQEGSEAITNTAVLTTALTTVSTTTRLSVTGYWMLLSLSSQGSLKWILRETIIQHDCSQSLLVNEKSIQLSFFL